MITGEGMIAVAQEAVIEKGDPCHLKDHSDEAEHLRIRPAERKLFQTKLIFFPENWLNVFIVLVCLLITVTIVPTKKSIWKNGIHVPFSVCNYHSEFVHEIWRNFFLALAKYVMYV